MRKNKISLEEHNDNCLLILSGIVIGMIMLSVAHLLVSIAK